MRTETTPQRSPGPPLLIGEAPPPGGLGPAGPFDCASGDNLARFLTDNATARGERRGFVRADVLAGFVRVNLLHEWPGSRGKGSALPRSSARVSARDLLERVPGGRRVVVAGQRVADALGLRLPLGAWLRWRGSQWAVIPHPSGLTREYNCADVREVAGGVLRRAMDLSAAELAAEVRIAPAAWYHFGYARFRGDLDQVRRALESATLRVFRWCATSPVSDRAHETLAAWRAYRRALALGLSLPVAVRAGAIALVHDRHEPLAGDMASPVKPLLRDDWRPIEQACAAAVADLYAGCAPLGSPLRPFHDEQGERAAAEQAHAADLDCAAIEAAWWHPTASDRVQTDPLCGAAAKALHGLPAPALEMLEVVAAGLDRAAWRGVDDLRAALDALSAELPALPLPGGEVPLAR